MKHPHIPSRILTATLIFTLISTPVCAPTVAASEPVFSSGSSFGAYKPTPTQGTTSDHQSNHQSPKDDTELDINGLDIAGKQEGDIFSRPSMGIGQLSVAEENAAEKHGPGNQPVEDKSVIQIYKPSKQLQNAQYLTPGAKIYNARLKGFCSIGYIALASTPQTQRKIPVIKTAGHCGNKGDSIYLVGPNNSKTYIGKFIASRIDGPGKADTGLILIENKKLRATESIIKTLYQRFQKPGEKSTQFMPPLNPEEAEKIVKNGGQTVRICHLGYRTGYTCGPHKSWLFRNGGFSFRGVSDHGDSGGPVYIVDALNKRIYPFGIFNGADSNDDTTLLGTIIYPEYTSGLLSFLW